MSRTTARRPLPRLVLLGGGHAHLRVLESLRDDRWPDVDAVLVSPEPRQLYSGMVPGFLQGTYSIDRISLPLTHLARRAGVRFIEGRATAVRAAERVVATSEGELPFDVLSLDVGSIAGGMERPGVRKHAFPLRPLERATRLRDRVDELARRGEARIAVVGAGAGGVEVALALDRRVADAGGVATTSLVDRHAEVLDEYSEAVRSRAGNLLRERGITLYLAVEAEGVDPEGVQFASGQRLHADLVVWATGAAPPPLLDRSDLPRSVQGYFSVDSTLRSCDGSPVWGAGDCIHIQGQDLPKAGVYAVRQGPVLARNLRAAIGGEAPIPYEPQASFLSILNTADGKALLRWRGLVSHSRPAWWLKDWIDRRFIRRYASE